jgi:peptide/nickel transport system permease protein
MWKIGWTHFKRQKTALLSLGIITILFLIAFLSPLLANNKPIILIQKGTISFPAFFDYSLIRIFKAPPATPEQGWEQYREEGDWVALFPPIPFSFKTTNIDYVLRSPGRSHILGTDSLGRDILSRMIHGSVVSLKVGILATGISLMIGLLLGAMSGYYGGKTDMAVSRLIEVVICFPSLFLFLTIIAIDPPLLRAIDPIYKVMIVIGLISWTGIARYVRGEFLKLKEIDYTRAAKAMGAKNIRIIVHHILPNSLAPVLVSASFSIAGAILAESALSFLGLGVQSPTPSWGNMLSEAQRYIHHAWWLALFPGIAIFLTVLSYNFLGEAIRDSFDPRMIER